MLKFLVIETHFKTKQQRFHYLMMPEIGEADFYRATASFNAFFNSLRKPRANVTADRQFTATGPEDMQFRMHLFKDVDWDNLRTFANIWEFYHAIGYDYKKRRHTEKS